MQRILLLLLATMLVLFVYQVEAKVGSRSKKTKAGKIEKANKQRFTSLVEQAKLSSECSGLNADDLVI